jgi:hypothetical protein
MNPIMIDEDSLAVGDWPPTTVSVAARTAARSPEELAEADERYWIEFLL